VKKTNNTLAVAGDASSGIRVVRKGNEDLVKAIDAAIADMQKDGSLKALSEKWFGADVTK
jgi:cystine transport system substrate-binding protein